MPLPALHVASCQSENKTNAQSSLFILHYLTCSYKAASSFECDGCGHHASFHSLENAAEDAIRQKWSEEEAQAKEQQAAVGANKKRKMLAQNSVKDDERIVVLDDVEGRDGNLVRASRSKKS